MTNKKIILITALVSALLMNVTACGKANDSATVSVKDDTVQIETNQIEKDIEMSAETADIKVKELPVEDFEALVNTGYDGYAPIDYGQGISITQTGNGVEFGRDGVKDGGRIWNELLHKDKKLVFADGHYMAWCGNDVVYYLEFEAPIDNMYFGELFGTLRGELCHFMIANTSGDQNVYYLHDTISLDNYTMLVNGLEDNSEEIYEIYIFDSEGNLIDRYE
ncbi:hypothetical protein [Butyrivibrio sp. YAB3001]|uniref:hypothetical protein n=1 Tax=Butyrivibrio sp. YAB3001 TaxID=1520812 RepID=UPI0008F6229B|nr:hypothetical protein [Butyrivibrio sp. YAB3001]SFC42231.1 hypothetical protein SAMN02910398_02223 [Butyrivibrio sp. YAB3001]